MANAPRRMYRVGTVVATVFAATLAGAGVGPAAAQVTGVKGSAFGYSLNVSLFNSPQPVVGPTPTVSLPAGGSASPVTNSAPSGVAGAGPARFFTSEGITVSTQGTTGASGSVTSSVTINNLLDTRGEVFKASSASSTCTASASGVSGSTTINGGTLQTDSGDDDTSNSIPDHALATVGVPANPAPNTTIEGHIHVNGTTDNFRYVFNEQIRGGDGSLTVNAAHMYLLGPTAVGDLILGQSVCGVTATAATTTTTTGPGDTTTTAAPGATTTTAAGATTTTAAAGATTTTAAPSATTTTAAPAATTSTAAPPETTTTTASPGDVAGGGYGYFVTVALFGGSPGTRGPAPTVTLPAGGSSSPVTDSIGTATAQFGPAILFSSDGIEVRTQGTPGGTVTSSARITNANRSEQEQFTAATVSSSCEATTSGASGSTSISGGRLTTSSGTDFDVEDDDTIVQLPASPAPNTSYEGKIENVGDSFRVVLNEQTRTAGGITVNAMHMYLLGPTAVGELIVGQSRCGATSGGGGGGGATLTAAGSGGSKLATTGGAIAVVVAFAMVLAMGGCTTTYWVGGARFRERVARRMPWSSPARLR